MPKIELRSYSKARTPLGTLLRLFRYFRHCRLILISAVVSILLYCAATIAASYAMRPLVNLLEGSTLSVSATYAKYLALLLGLLLLLCLREKRYVPALRIYVLCVRFSADLDYGVSGIGLMVIFYLFLEHPALCFAASTAYMLVWSADGHGYPIFGMEFGMRIFATPAVMLASLPIRRKTRTPKWLSYGFYPAHLLALLALEKFF